MTRTVKAKTSHGTVKFNYCIATPTDNDAAAVDPSLPTVLFLHPVYIAMKIFQPQFGDANVRRFNLVSTDLLSHGLTEGKVPAKYGQKDAAADVVAFMDANKLPPCIIFGLSMGTIIGIQLALSYPEKVKGLFLVSPLGSEEPEDVAEGRRQIHDTWCEAFKGKNVDQEAISDSVFGALQLGFNSKPSSLVNAMVEIIVPQALNNWGPKKLDDFETITVKFFTERKGYTNDQLTKLRNIPVFLVHCLDDIAYSPQYLMKFANQLKESGVNTTIQDVDGAPHFGSVTHFTTVNPLLVQFVLDQWKGPAVPPAQTGSVVSPFEVHLRKAGWTGYESDDE
ncbi:alpha/beta-hydrolase [Exidia glandulosa HHB12029]|uniref:Alpha/beta-hydrolase n=1 Tax=Exidia glandulosa HHB12029 TaxID=1314781 RepID=A0A165H5T7_EXIGL|nr:alpha/beta-hydrolase [Exidia glandulosa HHB12029]